MYQSKTETEEVLKEDTWRKRWYRNTEERAATSSQGMLTATRSWKASKSSPLGSPEGAWSCLYPDFKHQDSRIQL